MALLLACLNVRVCICVSKRERASLCFHSISFGACFDVLAHVQAILGLGLREAERSPDHDYQYGYGRAAFFYSLLTALSTFGFGAIYTVYQGVDVLMHPQHNLQTLPETWAILGSGYVDMCMVYICLCRY